MKLLTISEIIEIWKNRFAQSGMEYDKLPSPGYLRESIEQVEQHLGFQLNIQCMELIQKIKLDTVSFRNLSFGGGGGYLIYLSDMNDGAYGYQATADGLLNIGGGGKYILFLNNATGKIYVEDMYDQDVFLVANDIETFISIAATLASQVWPKFRDRKQAIQFGKVFLKEQRIELGEMLWVDLIRNAI